MKITKKPSPNFDERKAPIDMLVLHYTGRPSLEESLDWLCDPAKRVSAHYCVGEGGEIFQLVDEGKRAWHAGVSYWRGVTDINSCSIGIEIQNPGHAFGYQDYPAAQIRAVIDLSQDIIQRHGIPANRILGHSDVAPERKPDPGEKFPWRHLAKHGVGLWPPEKGDLSGAAGQGVRAYFTNFGYSPSASDLDVIMAFQRHWYPENVTGTVDEETFARLLALL